MYSVILVDDEHWILYGLQNLIDWEAEGFSIAGTAINGPQAHELIGKVKPDAVFADIRIPGMNGLDLFQKVKEGSSVAEFVFISGYADFQYARQALQQGAFDYLLKPVEKDVLLDTLRRLSFKLNEKRRHQVQLLDASLLESLLDHAEAARESDMLLILNQVGLPCQEPRFGVILCSMGDENPAREIWNLLTASGISFIDGVISRNRHIFLVNTEACRMPELTAHWKDALPLLDSRVGLSSLGKSALSIPRLLQEADISICQSFVESGGGVTYFPENQQPFCSTAWMSALEQAVSDQRYDVAHALLDEQLSAIYRDNYNVQEICRIGNHLLAMIHRIRIRKGLFEIPDYMDYIQMMRTYSSAKAMFHEFKQYMSIEPVMETPYVSEQVSTIIQYINYHLDEDISLGEVALHFNISLGHLSSLVKKKLGTTFMEHVTTRKLGKAKKLLEGTSKTVEEIAYEVGYKDYFHFTKLFKKHVGVSPSKYRKPNTNTHQPPGGLAVD